MGILKKISGALKLKKEKMTILFIGLNNSGKSTIVNYFKNPHAQTPISVPTVGFSMEQFQSHGVVFNVIDMSGNGRYRSLWEHHFKTCQGIVFVIDSNDAMRLVVIKDELGILLKHDDLKNRYIPILFYCNKSDCENTMSSVKIAAALNLSEIEGKSWHISASNALSGDGLEEGIQWLVQQIRNSVANSKKGSKKRAIYNN